ncbi:hypothetical protein [Streptomyces coeruleorubidus]|uniref:hypothetical protein n=1 Tax=Streptomyces coeruleorubidus TaxID=116188 RepID=UPI00368BA2E7
MDDSLSFESFLLGAKKAAHAAMDDHGRPDYNEFALHAGVAVERLAKATLVSKNPVYIAEIRNADMLLYFGGDLRLPTEKVRTVGAKDAVARLRRIGVLQADPQLDLLIEMRNGAAHASSSGDEAREMILPFARTIQALLDHLGEKLVTFWARWTDAVWAAVNEQEDQLFRDMRLRIAQARHAFDDRFTGLPDHVKQHALAPPGPPLNQVLADPLETMSNGKPALLTSGGTCPACTGPAILRFERTSCTGSRTTYASTAFGCHLCTFRAEGYEEMAALRKVLPDLATPTLTLDDGEDGQESLW